MKLFCKECRKIAGSVIYYIFLLLLIAMWVTNFAGGTKQEIQMAEGDAAEDGTQMNVSVLREPQETDTFFGSKAQEVPDQIMTGVAEQLIREYLNNGYATYPYGYYKKVVLSEEEQQSVLAIIEEITGLSREEITDIPEGYFPQMNGSTIHFSADSTMNVDGSVIIPANQDTTAQFKSKVSYARFKILMEQMESILGNGSGYSMEWMLSYYGQTDMDYEQAMEEYETTLTKDKITGGFARLFCDYMSIPLSLLPIFLAVLFAMQDRRARMQELVYTRSSSSIRLLGVRYMAGVSMTLLPVCVLSLESLLPLAGFAMRHQLAINYLAYAQYILWWLLPTVLFVWSLGYSITILTDSPLALAIGFLVWFLSVGTTGLEGDVHWYTLMIRHNSLNGYDLMQQNAGSIWLNRGLLVVVSAVLFTVTVLLYERKRRGSINAAGWYTRLWSAGRHKLHVMHQK